MSRIETYDLLRFHEEKIVFSLKNIFIYEQKSYKNYGSGIFFKFTEKNTSVGSNITPIIYFPGHNPKDGNRKVQKVNKLAFKKQDQFTEKTDLAKKYCNIILLQFSGWKKIFFREIKRIVGNLRKIGKNPSISLIVCSEVFAKKQTKNGFFFTSINTPN